MRTWSVIGWRNPAVLTALGRAMLGQKFIDFASFSERFPSSVEKRTAFTKTSRKAIWQELLDLRERGFALEHQEYIVGVGCVAVAILRGPEGHRRHQHYGAVAPPGHERRGAPGACVGRMHQPASSARPQSAEADPAKIAARPQDTARPALFRRAASPSSNISGDAAPS